MWSHLQALFQYGSAQEPVSVSLFAVLKYKVIMPILYILTEKVDRLLTLLTSYKLPNDDTLLEKLLNWIDGVVHRDAVVKNQTLAEGER